MRHYREKPDNFKTQYSVFLIQNLENLTSTNIEVIFQQALKKQFIISFEKLNKGTKLATVVYGPREILLNFTSEFGLIELEDYTSKLQHFVSCWEIGDKPNSNKRYQLESLVLDIPILTDQEQVWRQIVIQAEKSRSDESLKLRTSMRILMQSPDQHRLNNFNHQILSSLEEFGLSFLPQVYSIHQLVRFYRERALGGSVLHRNEYITHLDLKSLENLLV